MGYQSLGFEGYSSIEYKLKEGSYLYRGMPFLAAPALQTAMDTPKMALAPSLALLSVPSNFSIKLSISFCWVISMPWKKTHTMLSLPCC